MIAILLHHKNWMGITGEVKENIKWHFEQNKPLHPMAYGDLSLVCDDVELYLIALSHFTAKHAVVS